MIYLDHAATTPVLPAALEAAWPWLTSGYGNPNSTHELGLAAAGALQWSREQCANWLGCYPDEVVFTSGGTEGNNLAIQGIALGNPRGRHLISSPTEHSSVLRVLEFLRDFHGFELTLLPVDERGSVAVADLQSVLRPDTTLVTLMTANNEVGTLHPIAELAAVCSGAAVPFHTDAVQSAGWQALNVRQLGVSALTLSGHKLGAPKGSGLVYMSSRQTVVPVLHGGGQEHALRGGTPNVAWAVALATALAATPNAEAAETEAARVAALRDEFVARVRQAVPTARLTGTESGAARHPALASLVFPGVNGETLLLELESNGVICSSGSACSANSTEPSHVLTALGYEADLATTAVRFSLSHSTSQQDLHKTAEALIDAHSKLTKGR